MTRFLKSIDDIVALWERTEPIHLYPPFSIEWTLIQENRVFLGIMRRTEGRCTGNYASEVWEVGVE